MKEKTQIENLKRMDRRENVERIMRMQDYRRDKLWEKVKQKMDRADIIK